MSAQVSNTVLNLLRSQPVFYVLETTAGRFNTENGEDILVQTDMTNLSNDMKQFATAVILDPTFLPMSRYENQPIFKIAYYSPDHSITEQLSAALHGIAKVVEFDNIPEFPLNMGEISDFSVNKGLSMLDVCRHFKKTASDCIAFGDSMNDVEILTAAGLGIAMFNANEEVKAIADKVCDSCENDGIAKALQELGLI
jgi:hydroxymethylpyrimidine pyrophosphatase-like HAD family hydrolase